MSLALHHRRRDRRRAHTPPPLPVSLRARIRVKVAEAALPEIRRAPMEALLAVVRDETLGLDAADLHALARQGLRLMEADPEFGTAFHRLRLSIGY